jgi:hypothetical protein
MEDGIMLLNEKSGVTGISPSQLAAPSSPVPASRAVAEIEDRSGSDYNDNKDSRDNICE